MCPPSPPPVQRYPELDLPTSLSPRSTATSGEKNTEVVSSDVMYTDYSPSYASTVVSSEGSCVVPQYSTSINREESYYTCSEDTQDSFNPVLSQHSVSDNNNNNNDKENYENMTASHSSASDIFDSIDLTSDDDGSLPYNDFVHMYCRDLDVSDYVGRLDRYKQYLQDNAGRSLLLSPPSPCTVNKVYVTDYKSINCITVSDGEESGKDSDIECIAVEPGRNKGGKGRLKLKKEREIQN